MRDEFLIKCRLAAAAEISEDLVFAHLSVGVAYAEVCSFG
jgi:hypothetical protein